MRIAAHNGGREFGGGEKWTLLLLRGLAERGHEVRLYGRDQAMVERAAEHGVPAEAARLGGHLMLPHALRLAGRLRAWRPDALIVTTYKKIWLAGMAAALAGVPRVVSRIGLSTDLPRRHWSYRLALRRWTDVVAVNADSIRRDFHADLPDAPAEFVRTIHDGVALPAPPPPPDAARRALGLPVDAPVVGSVTRLADQKRLDRMIDALARLPGVHLALAGTGPLEAELRRRAAQAGVADRVHFLGFRRDVETVLGALDLFLLTSDREGMANAMLEAMAAGVPVVSTDVSGAREALEGPAGPDGVAPQGRIVPDAPEDIARAVRELLEDPDRLRAMGEAARARQEERFSYEAMLDAWEALLAGTG